MEHLLPLFMREVKVLELLIKLKAGMEQLGVRLLKLMKLKENRVQQEFRLLV